MTDTFIKFKTRNRGGIITVPKGYDNWFFVLLYQNGSLFDLSNRTNLIITIKNDTDHYNMSEDIEPENFHITGGAGELMIKLGKTSAPIGRYSLLITYYDLLNSTGLLFNINQSHTIEVV